MTRAIEVTGTVGDDHRLRLDAPVPLGGRSRVRVILLVDDPTDIEEALWRNGASAVADWAWLNDPAEDLYTFEDGMPFHDQG